MAVTSKLSELEPLLEEPNLYQIQPEDNYQVVSRATNERMKISLYRYDGVLLYSSITDTYSLIKPIKICCMRT